MTQITKGRAREALLRAREDINLLMRRQIESQQEIYRLLAITEELYEGITGEDAPPVELRAVV